MTDYSPDKISEPRKITVKFNNLKVSDMQNLVYDEHDIELNTFESTGLVKGFSVKIRHHEVMIFKLL